MSRKSDWLFVLSTGIFAILHLPFLDAPNLNLEDFFLHAARQFAIGGLWADTSLYHSWMTNSEGLPMVLSLFFRILPSTTATARTLVFLSSLAFLVTLWRCLRLTIGPAQATVAMLIIETSPLFWVYAGRLSSDAAMLAAYGGAMALILCTARKPSWLNLLGAALLLLVAVIIKYPAIILAVTVFPALAWVGQQRGLVRPWRWAVRSSMIVGAPAVLAMFLYLTYAYMKYGEVLNPDLQPDMFRQTFDMVFLNVLRYLFWAGVATGPLILVPLLCVVRSQQRAGMHRRRFLVGWVISITLALSTMASVPVLTSGESKLPYFIEPLVQGWLFVLPIACAVFLIVWLFVGAVENAYMERNWTWVVWSGVVVIGFSFVRMSNRYALFLLPPMAVVIAKLVPELLSRRWFTWFATASFVASGTIGLMLDAYWAAQGRAAGQLSRFAATHCPDGVAQYGHALEELGDTPFYSLSENASCIYQQTREAPVSPDAYLYSVPIRVLGFPLKWLHLASHSP